MDLQPYAAVSFFPRQAGREITWYSKNYGHYTEMSVHGIIETMSVFVSIYMIYS